MSYNLVKRKVVIIGNGIFGSQIAATLSKNPKLSVIVITPFDFTEIPMLMTKVIAIGAEEHNKSLYPNPKEDNVEYEIGIVTSISDTSVTLKSGKIIQFDVAVVATGIQYPIFRPNPEIGNVDARKTEIIELNKSIKNAKTIVISGGGAVGCELASDIKLRYADKRVVLVTSSVTVLDIMTPKLSMIGNAKLQEQGVEIITSDRVLAFNDGKATLKSGKTIFADLHIPAYSTGGNSSFMPSSSVNEKGYIIVDDYLKVKGFNNVFASGDVSERTFNKAAISVDDQLPTISFNVIAKIDNKPLKKHVIGGTFLGTVKGPVLVALGHGVDGGFGLGPDLPGCPGFCVWFCCFCGPPCSPPAGKNVMTIKNDFNYTISPKKGKGISK